MTIGVSKTKKKRRPVIAGSWLIGKNPTNLGDELQNEIHQPPDGLGQEVVDHHLWKDAHGRWRLWACVRHVKAGRVFVGWVSNRLESPDWDCLGVVMRRDKNAGESLGDHGGRLYGELIMSPFVVQAYGRYWLFYGGGYADTGQYNWLCSICLATSSDGITFARYKNMHGDSVLFYGPGEARDPCVVEIDGLWHMYYSGWETGFPEPNRIYLRTSRDLLSWSASREVCWGGSPGCHAASAECPHVCCREGYYYLFRTTDYASGSTYVYRSENPHDFGLDTDRCLIGTLDAAAPEIIVDRGKEYITSSKDLSGGIRLHHLEWRDG